MNGKRSRPLHVAVVSGHPAQTGGMEKFCRFLVRSLLETDWLVSAALSGHNIYDELETTSGGRLGIDRVEWLDHTFAGDRDYQWSRIADRRRWFRRVRPDVAVFVQSSNTPLRASIVGAALAGVPIVTTHRTMPWPVEDVPAHRHFFGLLPGLHLHRRKVVFKTWLTAGMARATVFNSHEVRANYERLYLYPPRKSIVIPNVVEPPAEAGPVQRASAPSDGCTIGYVGRISREKRIEVLIHALARMDTPRPVRLMLWGEGPEQPKLTALADEVGVSERITWAGPTRDVWSAYRQCDVVTLCSPRESSSNMILEAMAAGLAVVVTRVGGLPELVDHGRLGICVPPLEPHALAAALTGLVENEPLRRELGRRARQAVLQRHDPRGIADQWRHLLRQAADRRWKVRGVTEAMSDNHTPISPAADFGCASA
ncbi:MAG TPA: glycosyltransferase family 4 protein [Phycisphaerae bacterium]|nr:glycosyltransferase family 4 protein [Phycisphaerae bacterium]